MAVAIDATGREVARWRGPNTPEGWRQLVVWAAALDGDSRWGIEGAWNYGRGLAQFLVEAGATVYEVNARWTAAGRRRARTPGKSDGLDARAVALVVWREAGTLPAIAADDETGILALLVSERDGVVTEATRLRNQAHQLLLQLDPGYRTRIPSLKTRQGLRALVSYATDDQRPLQQQRAGMLRRLAQRLQLLVEQARVDCTPITRPRGKPTFPGAIDSPDEEEESDAWTNLQPRVQVGDRAPSRERRATPGPDLSRT